MVQAGFQIVTNDDGAAVGVSLWMDGAETTCEAKLTEEDIERKLSEIESDEPQLNHTTTVTADQLEGFMKSWMKKKVPSLLIFSILP